jgi:hypothetical protein
MGKNIVTRQSGSSQLVKEELKKFTEITDTEQVEKIKLYIGVSKLADSFKTFFIPKGVATPEEVWASQSNPHPDWSEVFHIKILNRNDWQLFECPVCAHEIMLRTKHETGNEIRSIPATGECDYCKTKFPNPMVRTPQLGRRNHQYEATNTII